MLLPIAVATILKSAMMKSSWSDCQTVLLRIACALPHSIRNCCRHVDKYCMRCGFVLRLDCHAHACFNLHCCQDGCCLLFTLCFVVHQIHLDPCCFACLFWVVVLSAFALYADRTPASVGKMCGFMFPSFLFSWLLWCWCSSRSPRLLLLPWITCVKLIFVCCVLFRVCWTCPLYVECCLPLCCLHVVSIATSGATSVCCGMYKFLLGWTCTRFQYGPSLYQ